MWQNLEKEFTEKYGRKPLVIAAPGRVNLIGEHTDYNEGFVLPGAVDKCIYVAMAQNDSANINVFARQFNESASFPVNEQSPRKGWLNYLIGVNYLLQEKTGRATGGLDVMIDGDIPVGAGMSSSAALCSAFGFGLNHVFDLGQSRMELARIGQQTEHRFVGVKCGIMDQFASLHGRKGHVMKLDCRSMEFEYIPFNFPDVRIVLVNTMVSHSLAGSEYNQRRQQCEEGVKIMKKYLPEIHSLRDVPYEQLAKHWQEFPPVVYERCSYVISENQRLLAGCDALRNNDLQGFGEMMFGSHKGLSRHYAVSCPELDLLVELARPMSSVLGARMMGGGFGGCTINVVQADQVEKFTDEIQQGFKSKFNVLPEVYVTKIEDGTRIVNG